MKLPSQLANGDSTAVDFPAEGISYTFAREDSRNWVWFGACVPRKDEGEEPPPQIEVPNDMADFLFRQFANQLGAQVS